MNNKHLLVSCNHRGEPRLIRNGSQSLAVEQILEQWRDTGCWWEGESEKAFYRLVCRDGSVREIFCDLVSGQWYVYKIYD